MASLAHTALQDLRRDWTPVEQSGSLATHVEAEGGIVCVTGAGRWDIAYVDAHFRELERIVMNLRGGGFIRAMIDLRQASSQDPEVIERIYYWTSRIYRGADRIAIVVANSLAKVNTKRMIDRALTETFISVDAARTWLHAY